MRYSSYGRLWGTRNIEKTKFTVRFSKPFSTCKQNIRCPNMDVTTCSLSPMGGNCPYNITYPRGESFACLRRKVKQATARLHIQRQYGARKTRVYHEQNDKMTCPALAVHYHLIGIYRGRHKRGQTDELCKILNPIGELTYTNCTHLLTTFAKKKMRRVTYG